MYPADDPTGFLGERPDGPDQAFAGYDYVIRCTGWRMETEIFDVGLGPIIGAGNKYPQMTAAYGHPTVDGLYYAGTLMHGNDFKKSSGGFIHGFRYLVRAQHRILELRNHGVLWPASEVMQLPRSLEKSRALVKLGQRLLPRVSEMSGPYQMFGQLLDVYVLTSNKDSESAVVVRYEEVPKDFIPELLESVRAAVLTNHAGIAEKNKPLLGQYWTCGFEYGKGYGGYENGHLRDPLSDDRVVRPFDEQDPNGPGAKSNFLHPVRAVPVHSLCPCLSASLALCHVCAQCLGPGAKWLSASRWVDTRRFSATTATTMIAVQQPRSARSTSARTYTPRGTGSGTTSR